MNLAHFDDIKAPALDMVVEAYAADCQVLQTAWQWVLASAP